MHEIGHLAGQQAKRIGPNPLKQAPKIITKHTNNYKRKSGPTEQAKRFELQKLQSCQNRQICDFDIRTRRNARSRPHDRPAGQEGWAQSPQAGAPIITKTTYNYIRKSGPIEQAKRFELQKLQSCQNRQIGT